MARSAAPMKTVKTVTTYTKAQILKAARYQARKDLLTSILKDGEEYTFNGVDALIAGFDGKKFTERKGEK